MIKFQGQKYSSWREVMEAVRRLLIFTIAAPLMVPPLVKEEGTGCSDDPKPKGLGSKRIGQEWDARVPIKVGTQPTCMAYVKRSFDLDWAIIEPSKRNMAFRVMLWEDFEEIAEHPVKWITSENSERVYHSPANNRMLAAL
jgi:hypothetical protein